MAVAQVSSAPSRADYNTVVKHLDLEANRPAGLIVHSAAEMPNGEVQILDVYESRESLEAFAQTRLFPAFEAAGLMERMVERAERIGRPEAYETFDLVV